VEEKLTIENSLKDNPKGRKPSIDLGQKLMKN